MIEAHPSDRISYQPYLDKIIDAQNAILHIRNNDVIGVSGFTKAGDSKSVLPAFVERAKNEGLKITLISGASLGYGTDGELAKNNVLHKRMPFQVDPTLRKSINKHETLYIDQHLSEVAELLHNGHLPKIDMAIIEASSIDENGNIIPTTSVGNSATFAALADKIIIEINLTTPKAFKGIHDIHLAESYPHRQPFDITHADSRIGSDFIAVDPEKVVGIVFTNIPDSPAIHCDSDECTDAISEHLQKFFHDEVVAGRLTKSLLPLQVGIGKIANSVMSGFKKSEFENLTMYSEVLQDSTFELFDSGKLTFASASSITVSEDFHNRLIENFDFYKDKILLRPQNISNSPEAIRRLGVISINTAIEFDIYGNVNSTHLSGTHIMNGIGGSGDFARNAYLCIFVSPSVSKEGAISHIVPMVTHVDHNEHDVDILVTECGLADLRGLAPIERAEVIIEKCVHPDYRDQVRAYFAEARQKGGQTPHVLDKAFSWHVNLSRNGTMRLSDK